MWVWFIKYLGHDFNGNRVIQVEKDRYDFDMHEVSSAYEFFRNVATVIGSAVAGSGTPFDILFKNFIRIK